jgi:hypothetical protein
MRGLNVRTTSSSIKALIRFFHRQSELVALCSRLISPPALAAVDPANRPI